MRDLGFLREKPHDKDDKRDKAAMIMVHPILWLMLMAWPALGQAKPYRMLYVFGDSYSDTGAGFQDSDGPTAVAYLAQRLGIPFTYFGDSHSAGKGLNFAVSGGKTGVGVGQRTLTGAVFGRGMRNQVDEFAGLVKAGKVKFDPAQTMFFFAGGLNDRGEPEGSTVANLEGEIETLYGLGARRFMVALLPVAIPYFTTAGRQLNPGLAEIPAAMRARHADIQIANSHWGDFFDAVIEHPKEYGIADTVDPCVAGRPFLGLNACSSPETHYYYYAAHPSTAVHRAVGSMLYGEATSGTKTANGGSGAR